MNGVKIKIECDDKLLSAAIASTIARALEADRFNNVKVKTLMVYHEVIGFSKKSIISELLRDPIQYLRPPMYETELLPVYYIDTDPPSTLAKAVERNPQILNTPVLIDMGIESASYAEKEADHLSGKWDRHTT